MRLMIYIGIVITIIFFTIVKAAAQQNVSISNLAESVVAKGLKETDLGTYQGSLLLQAMTELAIAEKDKQAIGECNEIFKKFGTGEIHGKGSFISYGVGGNGAAYLNYRSNDTLLRRQVSDAARRMLSQQKRSGEGLLVPGWITDGSDQVFIDMAFAVTPYMLYAGLKENNTRYIDLAVYETLELFKILKDKQTGLLHQGRGFAAKYQLSGDNWSRGNGWGALAIASLVRDLPDNHPKKRQVDSVAKEFFKAVIRHQDNKGLWHQEMTESTSFTETSGSGLLLYGIGVMLQKKLIDERYKENFLRGINNLTAYIAADGSVSHACFSCLCPRKGTKADYINHVWVYNDPHGFGPVVLAFAQAMNLGITELKVTTQIGVQAVLDTTTHVVKSYVRYIPERKEDIAWENDRIAFRLYGPPARDKVGSGIDIFAKSVDYSIIDKWYRLNARGLDYHVDRGEGADFYHAGFFRGCGGTAIWKNEKAYPSETYASHRLIENSADKIVFCVNFDPWDVAGSLVSESKIITMVKGTNFFKVENTIRTNSMKNLIIGIGLTTFDQPSIMKEKSKGVLASWDKPDSVHGHLGTAVVANPKQIEGFVKHEKDEYLLLKVQPNQIFTYYVGAGWEGNDLFKKSGSWQDLLLVTNWQTLNAIYKCK